MIWRLLFARPRRYRWVCACGYRKQEVVVHAETRDCPYCYREVVPERLHG